MPKPDAPNSDEKALEHFRSMGLEARRVRGGRSVIASMDISSQPFETMAEPLAATRVLFSAVGRDRIKCLRPRFLFALPILNVQTCSTPAAIEARIRNAWRDHLAELRKTHEWLSDIGVERISAEGASVLSFPLEGEEQAAKVRMRDGKQMILPSRGRLSGATLGDPEHRTISLNQTIDSGVDLEISISTRLEELARLQRRRAEDQRRHAMQFSAPTPGRIDGRRPHSVLLVGQRLVAETPCIESLRLRGYRVHRAAGAQEALACFTQVSPELVLADVQLGRSEGIDLILALRELGGVEDIPVLLVDGHHRPERRNAARDVGAAGYLTYPIDVSRIAARLAHILDEPAKRRFTRYDQRVSVRINGLQRPCITSTLGRGGMFLSTVDDFPDWSLYDCELALPGFAEPIGLEAEVRYRYESRASSHGVGMRFHAFNDRDESLLIDYLSTLEDGGWVG